jgi:hypothetical protein
LKARIYILGYYAVLFLIFGVAGLIAPETIASLVHYDFQSSIAQMEFMATYGGLFIGLGAFMFYCIKSNVQLGLVCVLLTMGAMLLARTVGFFSFGQANTIQYIYLAGELFTVLLVGFILLKTNSHVQQA